MVLVDEFGYKCKQTKVELKYIEYQLPSIQIPSTKQIYLKKIRLGVERKLIVL